MKFELITNIAQLDSASRFEWDDFYDPCASGHLRLQTSQDVGRRVQSGELHDRHIIYFLQEVLSRFTRRRSFFSPLAREAPSQLPFAAGQNP